MKRDFMKKFFKTIISIIVIVAALILFLNWANKTEKYECEIEEIQSGIYARYQSTASSIPADNYEIITVCINGQHLS
jgi:YbbR domain-containing protein